MKAEFDAAPLILVCGPVGPRGKPSVIVLKIILDFLDFLGLPTVQTDQRLTRCRLAGGKQLVVQGHADVSEDFLLVSVGVQLGEQQK